ncbi:wax ester/triacylglycerol synthase domain-containing protein [Streptomyces sp. QL37]|uniref:wax ester/triacylglycerol synthase domain-containing protein n=1 Tax=Streptomyces sp. QL37 TaxID=2093747 RepID=UPI001374E779|nr:wax ester/triacylglycerol synthase domain-containing protein [Streptomyces sp. QL37]
MLISTRPSLMDLTMHDMAQKQPWLSQTIGAALHLQGTAPALADLRAYVGGRLSLLPCLTHYLQGGGLRARWVHDPRPDLQPRIRERELVPGKDSLDAVLQDLLTQPLPASGPLWDLWLLHGHVAHQYTLCYRAHHSGQDGAAVINALHNLFGAVLPHAPTGTNPVAGPRACASTLRGMLAALAHNNIWNDPAHVLDDSRISTWASVPTRLLHDMGAARGGSGNDAFLATLATAVRTWTHSHWARGIGRPVPAVMMANLRRAHEAGHPGNLFAYATVPLPSHEPTHQARLDAVITATQGPKSPLRREATRTILDRTPTRLGRALADRLTTPSRAVVDTSYVAVRRPLHYQSDPVTHIQPFTWLPRNHPASVLACSYNGITTTHFLTNGALPEFHQLATHWEQAVSEAQVPGPRATPSPVGEQQETTARAATTPGPSTPRP